MIDDVIAVASSELQSACEDVMNNIKRLFKFILDNIQKQE